MCNDTGLLDSADFYSDHARLGLDEFMLDGSLAEFSAVNDVQKIGARVLLVNGVNEGSDHEESIRIFKLISDCTHVVFEGSTHFAHFEERAKYGTRERFPRIQRHNGFTRCL